MDYMSTPGGTPGSGIVLGYQASAILVGDELEKVRSKFQGFVKKLDSSNPMSSRVKTVKEFDQFI